MSRQLTWQRVMRSEGRCRICGEPTTSYATRSGKMKQYVKCSVHREADRQRYERSKQHKEKK